MATAAKEANNLLEAALAYAAKNLPVFPCNARDKKPLTDNGFYDASTDADTVRNWWLRWPNAMIGMPTGERTGFWALDIDDVEAFEAACKISLPATRRVDTGKGYHLYWRFDPARPVRNNQKNPKRGWPFSSLPGAETRGEGGYVIVPPSIHPDGPRYSWHDSATVIEPPAGLLKIVLKPERANDNAPPRQDEREAKPGGFMRDTAYGLAALEAECDTIRDAGLGEQESALNEGSLKIGSLVAGGELSKATARNQLIAAGLAMRSFDERNPWNVENVTAKVDRGLDDGARTPRSAPPREKSGVHLDDFHAFMPAHNYIFAPSGETWPATSVNSRIPPIPLVDKKGNPVLDKKGEQVEQAANQWLDQNRPVEQMTWAPGEPQVVRDRLISDGGWFRRAGCNVFNLYRPPTEMSGDPALAGRWIEHVEKIYPEEADHIIQWLAHRVQRPAEKINHAIVMGGSQGIGKDTILEPVKAAIGPWNFTEVSPQHMLGRFNGFVKSVILRVSEARDLGDVDRFAFYDHMKTYTAAPPDVLRVDEKNMREYAVFNVCGVIITTNHKTDGIYLPADDRRHYVAWSNIERSEFDEGYWTDLYRWYANGGIGHVAAYLRNLPLDDFDAKAPPPKTAAFWDIVSSNQAPEEAELADALDRLGWPSVVTISSIAAAACEDFGAWLRDRRNSRAIPHKLDTAGYVPVRNDSAKDGHFVVGMRRCAVYAKKTLARRDALLAVEKLVSNR
jgi:hypothetical protein